MATGLGLFFDAAFTLGFAALAPFAGAAARPAQASPSEHQSQGHSGHEDSDQQGCGDQGLH